MLLRVQPSAAAVRQRMRWRKGSDDTPRPRGPARPGRPGRDGKPEEAETVGRVALKTTGAGFFGQAST